MKPISLRFRCFGPYMDEQYIDFAGFEEGGLFLISGETGSGKTTILDAICYALYGRSSGGLRGDMEVMRCKLADKQDETLVEYIFEVNGERYCFTRSLKYGRKNLNDFHNCMIYRDGVYVPLFENPKATVVNQKAQELIGLNYDQFRQVVMLPQGQFEKLLVSDSAEKEKILVKLFHADRWQSIAEEIGRRVNARDNALKLQRQQIAAQLQVHGCDTLELLEDRISQQAKELAACEQALELAQKEQLLQKTQYEAALLDNQLFQQYQEARAAFQVLDLQRLHYDAEAQLLKTAATAQSMAPGYTARQAARKALDQVSRQLTAAVQSHQSAEAAWMLAKEALSQQENGRSAYEDKKQQLVLLENARPVYFGLETKEDALKKAEKAWRQAQQAEEKASAAFSRADADLQKAVARQREVMERYWQVQKGYFQCIGVTLANALVAGEPCPVCGSREHPAPTKPTGEVVTQEQVETAKAQMEEQNGTVSQAMKCREEKETAYNLSKEETRAMAQGHLLAQTAYAHALERRIPGIETGEQLANAVSEMKAQILAYEQAITQLSDAVQTANNALQKAVATEVNTRNAVEQAQQTDLQAQQQWQESLARHAMTEDTYLQAYMEPQLLQSRNAALTRYRADLELAEAALQKREAAIEGRTAPNLEEIQTAFESARSNVQALHTHQAMGKQALDALTRDREMISAALESYYAERIKVDEDLEFSNRLRGTNGLSLQRYVLAVMLTSITVAANRLLQDVYGGRYQLFRTNEIAGSGRKSGLELEVFDAAHAQRRSVTTLSGGEKFLVALSLALGLSTVVQAQGGGIRLDAMFVDEGFGSLDTEAVHDALDVLQSIRRSSGIVGIISHVDQLAETIPAKIQVTKGNHGSECHCIF